MGWYSYTSGAVRRPDPDDSSRNRKDQPSTNRPRSRSSSRSATVPPANRQRSRSSAAGSFINYLSNDGFRARSSSHGSPKQVVSLYKLLLLELGISSDSKVPASDHHQAIIENQAYKQIVDMIKIPFMLERFTLLGLLICANSFLTLFTLVPIRIAVVLIQALQTAAKQRNFTYHNISQRLTPVRKDILTVTVIVVSLLVLSLPPIDISKIYHDVRGQAQIKLYVMFGVLEVADKLCSSIGQNILGITYELVSARNSTFSFIVFFVVSVGYLSLHAYVLLYQTVSLNVAANSYSNALLTLLFSNQFSELRSSVFKKFDREGLFQLTMADLTERFQLSLMLSMITLRNILQLSSIGLGLVPYSWKSWNKWFGALCGPSMVVLGSEILVDWLKHCYISKFNRIKPRIYSNFTYVLALDYLEVFKSSSGKKDSQYELSDYTEVTKRIGLPLLATTVCFLRMSVGNFATVFIVETSSKVYSILSSVLLISVTFVILVLLRLILGIILLRTASYIKLTHESKIETEHDTTILDELAIMTNNEQDFSHLVDEDSPSKSQYLDRSSYEPPLSPKSPSPQSPVDLNFLPGSPNTEMSAINPSTREFLYDGDEVVPPTPEEKRNNDFSTRYESNYDEGLGKVLRYEMSSKRIW